MKLNLFIYLKRKKKNISQFFVFLSCLLPISTQMPIVDFFLWAVFEI